MKEELLKNGYITFDIDTNHTELNRIYTELIDNDKFDTLKISYNDVSDNNNKTPFVNFIKNELKKTELLNIDNLEQIWHWKEDQKCYDLLYSIFKKFYDYDFDKLNIMSTLTLFTKGCFINEHIDGRNKDRITGILIYLNKNYNEEKERNLEQYNFKIDNLIKDAIYDKGHLLSGISNARLFDEFCKTLLAFDGRGELAIHGVIAPFHRAGGLSVRANLSEEENRKGESQNRDQKMDVSNQRRGGFWCGFVVVFHRISW